MSTCISKYTTTEAVLEKDWPNIEGKFKVSFRSYKFIIKSYNAKETDDSLKFSINAPKSSIFLGSKYDVFFVLNVHNENPEKSVHIVHNVSKSEPGNNSNKLKFTIPFDCSKITTDSGFVQNDKITLKFYFYLLIDDDDENDDPTEEYIPGLYINEKCWKIPYLSNKNTYKSSEFYFNQYSFHFEIDNKDSNEPFKLNFICDKTSPTDPSLKFHFLILNLDGYPTLEVKKEWSDIKEKEKIEVQFDQTRNFIYDSQNGHNVHNCVYISILSKNMACKTSTIEEPVQINHSKEETGYVGLINQGATCYMNSMLQCLYHLLAFRRLVYNLPTTGEEDPKKSIPLNLQRLFGRMQLSPNPVSTESLTVSFGWDFSRTIIQHDTQEFSRVLLDNLEQKLKDKDKKAISKIFMGQYKSFIRCINVPFESSKIENYYDLTMDVEGCHNLEESFKKYIETEKMEGDNQYNTDDPKYGKQDALMGTEFIDFPPVLQLHLSRFKYDYYTDRMVKINDKFEFPEILDLNQFIPNKTEKSYLYDLYGVLVHSGTVGFGHYYAFLRTSFDNPQWYEFNDTFVTKVDKTTAIDNNFGGSSNYGNYGGYTYSEKSYSAYILVYVRRDDSKWIFESIKDEEIPNHVREFIEDPKSFESKISKSEVKEEVYKEEPETSIQITVTPDDSITLNLLNGKCGFVNTKLTKELTISSKDTRNDIYEKVASSFELKEGQFRLWTMYSGYPSFTFDKDNFNPYFTAYSSSLFLQHIENEGEEVNIKYDTYCLFLKFYSSFLSVPLQYIGYSLFDSQTANIEELFKKVNSILGMKSDTVFDVFTETNTNGGEVKPIDYRNDLKMLIKMTGLSNGAAVILTPSKKLENFDAYFDATKPRFQFIEKKIENKTEDNKGTTEKSSQKVEGEIPVFSLKKSGETVTEYFNMMDSKLLKISLFEYFHFLRPVCILQVPLMTDLATFKKFIIDSLKLDYDESKDTFTLHQKFFTHDYPNFQKVNEITIKDVKSLFNLNKNSVGVENDDEEPQILFFKFLKNVTQEQIIGKFLLNIQFSEDSVRITKRFQILFDKNANYSFDELFEHIQKNVDCEVRPDNLRIFSIGPKKIGKILSPKSGSVSQYINSIRVDLIPSDQLNLNTEDEVIIRFVMSKADVTGDVIITGDVFALKVNIKTDSFGDVKEKVQEICGFDDEKMKKVNFFVGEENTQVATKNALNDDSRFDKFKPDHNVFIVPIIKKSNKVKRKKEEALKIDN